MLNFDLQNHRPLREIVYEELKRQILTGTIVPGTRMMEVELADEMGVSRTPVREAIRKLEKEGLVIIEPRRGAYVSDISVKDILDNLEVREDLEGFAASLAAGKATKEELTEINEITDAYTDAVKTGDTQQMIQLDQEFHKRIVSMTGNQTLMQLYGPVQENALRFRYIYYDYFSGYETMPQEHKEIIAAIDSGDSDSAKKVAGAHIARLKEFVEREGDSGFKVEDK